MTERRDSPWTILFEHYDPADERRREAMQALGNGQLCWRASAPEAAASPGVGHRQHYAGLYRSGWYDEAPREVNGQSVAMAALVNLPDPFGLSLSPDGGESWLDLDRWPPQRYRQWLDLQAGRLLREIEVRVAGQLLCLREERLLSMATPHLALLRWELELPPGLQRLRLRAVLDGGVTNALVEKNRAYEGRRLRGLRVEHDASGRAVLGAHLQDPARQVAVAVQTRREGGELHWRGEWDGRRLVQEADCAVAGQARLVLEKRVVVQVDQALPSDPAAARAQVAALLPEEDFASLAARHTEAWRRLWAGLPLQLSDPALERPLRLHAFQLLQAVSPHSLGQDQGFPPRSWHEGYFGQVFWDEIFAFPVLVSHFPELARNLLQYRYRRLDTARERARRAGLRGALFPWRSARSGEEETPPFQYNPLSGRWMPDHTRLQRHIGAAIAFDAWQLFLATGDKDLLAGEAGELILEIARCWASLAQYDEARGRYAICGVIGPDEYHNGYPGAAQPGLDNNAYTNLMAVWTLRQGLELLEVLPAGRAGALRRRLGLEDGELRHWDVLSRRMYLPILKDGVLGQFDGFERLCPAPAAWLHDDDRPRLDWMLEARGDCSDRYQLTKQADVLTLLYLFPPRTLAALFERLGYPLGEAAIRRTADYHLAHITHESSLSTVVCAGALAALDPAASWAYFRQSLGVDLNAPSSGGTLEGVHLGAMAGSLDVLQRHYLGVQPTRDGLEVFPAPPAALGDVELGLCWRGARLRLVLEGETLTLGADVGNTGPVCLVHAGGRAWLRPGEGLRIACRRG